MTNKAGMDIDIRAHDFVTPSVKNIQSTIIRFVGAVSAALAATRAVAFPVQQAIEFEKELKNVQKTTGFTVAQIEQLGNSLNTMAKQMVISQVELAKIAATAGQLGLGQQGSEALLQFTESVARATSTFDISADVLADSAAQILNVFNIDTQNLENVFSSINEVSNNSVASAQKIIDILKRVGNVAGLTVTDVVALAATTQDVGVSSEVAGTTLVKQFSQMQSAASKFAEVMSITTEEWTARVDNDALGAFEDILKRLSELGTVARANNIRELFGGGRIFSLASKQVADAANNFQILGRNVRNATDAFAEGQSSIREYAVIASSQDAQTKNLGNTIRTLAIDAGNSLLPVLKEITASLKEFLNSRQAADFFNSLAESLKTSINFLTEAVKFIGQYELIWRNLLPTIAAFVAFKIARVFAAITGSILSSASALLVAKKNAQGLFTTWAGVGKKIDEILVKQNLLTAGSSAFARTAGGTVAAATREAPDARLAAQIAQRAAAEEQILARVRAQSAEYVKQNMLVLDTNRQRQRELVALETRRASLNAQTAKEIDLLNIRRRNELIGNAAYAKRLADIQREGIARNNLVNQERSAILQLIALDANRVKAAQALVAAQQARNAGLREEVALQLANAAAASRAAQGAFFSGPLGRAGRGDKAGVEAARAAQALAKANAASRGLLATLSSIGGVILRAITGPIGSLVITLGTVGFLFKDQIADMFGFVGDFQKDASKRFIAEEARKSRLAAQKAIEVYEKELDAAALSVNIKVDLASEDEDIRKAAEEQVKDRMDVLSRRVEGIDAQTSRVSNVFGLWAKQISLAESELREIDSSIEKLGGSSEVDVTSGLLTAPRLAYENRLKVLELEEKRAAVLARIEKFQKAESGQQRQLTDLAERRKAAEEELSDVARLQVSSLSAAGINALQLLARQKSIKEEYQSQLQVAGELLAEQESIITKIEELDDSQRGGPEGEKLAAELTEVNAAYEAARKAAQDFNVQAEQEGRRYADSLAEVTGSSVDSLAKIEKSYNAAQITALAAAESNKALGVQLKDTSLAASGTTSAIKAAAASYVLLGTGVAELRNSQSAIVAIEQAFKGMRDNLVQSLNATRRAVQDLFNEARQGAKDTQREFLASREITDSLNIRSIDRNEQQRVAALEERRAKAQRLNQQSSVEFYEREIAKVKEKAKIDREAEQARIKFSFLQKDIESRSKAIGEQEKEVLAVLNEQKAANETLRKLKEAQAQDPESVSVEEIAAAQATVDRLGTALLTATQGVEATKEKLKTLTSEAITTGQQLAVVGTTLSGAVSQAVPQEQIEGLVQTTASAIQRLGNIYSEAVTKGGSTLKDQATALEDLTNGIENLQKTALKGIGDIVTPEALGRITKAAKELISIRSSVLDIQNTEGALENLFGKAIGDDLDKIIKKGAFTIEELDIEKVNARLGATDEDIEALRLRTERGMGPIKVKLFADGIDVNGSNVNVDTGAATGGLIRGPGTGTSDSILARLSNREYVIKAAAVRKYGVGMFHALNSMRVDRLPAFAAGGYVGGEGGNPISKPGDVMEVRVNIGGTESTLRAERNQARRFVDSLNALNGSGR